MTIRTQEIKRALVRLTDGMGPRALAAKTNLSLYRAGEILAVRDRIRGGREVSDERALDAFLDVMDGNATPSALLAFDHNIDISEYLALTSLYHSTFEAVLETR